MSASPSDGYAGDELVPVMVQRSRLREVHALLGKPPYTPPAAGAVLDGNEGAGDDWTVGDFRRLSRDRRDSTRRMVMVFDVLAERADETVTLSELAELTGLSRGEVTGALSGFTRVCKSLWPETPDRDKPMRVSWGTTTQHNQQGEARYAMQASYAERWRQARGA